jgi:hypothetical protein
MLTSKFLRTAQNSWKAKIRITKERKGEEETEKNNKGIEIPPPFLFETFRDFILSCFRDSYWFAAQPRWVNSKSTFAMA